MWVSCGNIGTYDVQKVSVTEEEDNILVVCRFALGTDAQGFLVDIQTDDNRTVLSRNVSLIQCGSEQIQSSLPCLLETSFYKLELLEFGNFTLAPSVKFQVNVYNWDKDGSINKVFSKHLKVSTVIISTSTVTETETNYHIATGKQS